MKGLILSGGRGTRLRPLTTRADSSSSRWRTSRCCSDGIETLAAAGIRDIGIVVGDTRAEIEAAVGDGSAWDVRVTYIPQDAPRGLAHAVLIAEAFLGREPFVMYLGDNLLAHGIVPLVEDFAATRPAAQILLTPVAHPELYGVAETEGERVVRLVEKPAAPRSNLALVGVYMFGPEVFDSVQRIRPSARDELEITDAIQDLIDRGLEVRRHVVDGWWKDTGHLEDMLEANRLILDSLPRRIEGEVDDASRLEGKVAVEPGAVVTRSVVRGPVIIGHGARISDAYVGPFTAIMRDVEISGSEVEHSIVMEGSRITGLAGRVTDSLIGRNVTIARQPGKPRALRFMLGDRSEVSPPDGGGSSRRGSARGRSRPVEQPSTEPSRRVNERSCARPGRARGLMEVLRADDPFFERFGRLRPPPTAWSRPGIHERQVEPLRVRWRDDQAGAGRLRRDDSPTPRGINRVLPRHPEPMLVPSPTGPPR